MSTDYLPRAASQEMLEDQFPIPIPTPDGLRFADAQRGGQERDFRDNEQLLRSVADTLPVMIWMTGPDKSCIYANHRWLEFRGRPLEAELGRGWMEGIYPEDLERSWDTSSKAFDLREPFEIELRFRRRDGEYRWLQSSALPRFNAEGSFLGYIGSTTDISGRKLAEQSLFKVGKAWIEGQEEGGARVAQELRDYLDSLILLSVNLDRYEQNHSESIGDVRREIGEIRKQVNEIVNGILHLSHRLYPWKVEYLGLARAAESFCNEFADAQKVKIDFHSEGVPNELPKGIALCLYRVLEEALQNAMKHSASPRYDVLLNSKSNGIQLTVRDWGRGFDPVDATKGAGLGLANMKERLKLVDGVLSIESQPDSGTTIRAHVPLKQRANTATTA